MNSPAAPGSRIWKHGEPRKPSLERQAKAQAVKARLEIGNGTPLAGIYIAFCCVIFKIFRIPVNQWSLATATFGGIIGIFLLLLVMNYNHPFTTQARHLLHGHANSSGVRGRVIEVPVSRTCPSRRVTCCSGRSAPFEYVVEQKKAALAEAEQNVKQLKASLDQATAGAERAEAQFELAQQNSDRQAELFEKKAIAKATLDTFSRNLETARQTSPPPVPERAHGLAYRRNRRGEYRGRRLQAELRDA